jgi:hypothetical protein
MKPRSPRRRKGRHDNNNNNNNNGDNNEDERSYDDDLATADYLSENHTIVDMEGSRAAATNNTLASMEDDLDCGI